MAEDKDSKPQRPTQSNDPKRSEIRTPLNEEVKKGYLALPTRPPAPLDTTNVDPPPKKNKD